MKLSEICIKRPVLAWVMTFVMILIGLVGGYRLPLQQYPKIERSFITIETTIPSAGPEIVEAQVTRIIEDAVAGIEGIENITSMSSTEDSKVTLEFSPGINMDSATNNIRDRLSKSRDKLPDDATEPILVKSRAEERPIITLTLTSGKIPVDELYDFAVREIQKELEALPGVARVDVLGAGQYEMNIFLNPAKMAAYGISIADVSTALKRQSIEKPAGKLVSKSREYLVTTIARFEKPEEFESLIIASRKDRLIRIKDIGFAQITSNDKKTRTYYNGKPGISIPVVKQAVANPIDVARAVKKKMKVLESSLPENMTLNVGTDRTTFIEHSIYEVFKTILEATLLVIVVVLFFLRSARASFIPLVTIPVSLIGVLFLMYLLNFSLNMFTLMAMVLAIGLVVDDAIVVLENIYRYIEKGIPPVKASFQGIREISFSVIAMTLTLVAVYTPVSLAQGMTGKLMTEFAITLSGAVLLSGFAALTLSPMMCARMLKSHNDKPNPLGERFERWLKFDERFHKIEEKYKSKLLHFLSKPFHIISFGILFALFGFLIHTYLPSEFTPREDQGIISLEGQAPQTSTLEYTEKYVEKVNTILNQIPEIERYVTQIINPTFDVSIHLKKDRKKSTQEVSEELREKLNNITGIDVKVSGGSTGITGDDNQAVQFVIRGNKTYREIKDVTQNLTAELYNSGMILGVASEIRNDTEDFVISVMRDRLSTLNIEPATIAETIHAFIRGRKTNTFKLQDKMYEVRIQMNEEEKSDPNAILNLFIKAGDRDGTLIPISELVKITSRAGPIEIHRYNRMRAIAVSAFLKSSYSLSDGINLIDNTLKDVLPSDVRLNYTGETQRYLTEGKTIQLVFALALCFIYLVMAAQFESWRDPFIIILSAPLSLAGAVITLSLLKNGSLNLYSNIGLITLIGLITKHGILIVDVANHLRDKGLTIDKAIIEAATLRLRPILMTTFAMVLGALPLAFASGASAESRHQLGWVIVGGMSVGTLFTLFVIPAFYLLLSAKKRKPILREE